MQKPNTTIVDLEKLNTLNSEGCASCGRKFELGESIVLACGAWDGPPKYVHEKEAVYDAETAGFVERRCFESKKI